MQNEKKRLTSVAEKPINNKKLLIHKCVIALI